MIDAAIVMQLKTFFLAVICGWSIGAGCDLWKGIWRNLRAAAVMTDMIFWILAGIGLFLFTICTNDGLIRGYLLLGWFLGWLAYRCLFRKLIASLYIFAGVLLKKIKKAVKMSIGGR